MKINLIIDFVGVKNNDDVIYRLRKALGLFSSVSEEEYQSRIQNNNNISSWDAFVDDMEDIDEISKIVKNSPKKITELHLIIKNYHDIYNNISKDCQYLLSDILADLTGKIPYYCNLKFTFVVEPLFLEKK